MIMLRGLGLCGLGEMCWIPEANGIPGHWERPRAGQPCAAPPPPNTAPPIERDHRGDQVPSGGGVFVSEGPTSGTMTRAGVERLYLATSKAYYARELLAVKAWATSLAPCPPEAVEQLKRMGQAPTTMAATIPGTFEVYGVPFNIAEPGVTKSPRFERIYTPNNEQRILIEGAIINRSNALFDAALAQALAERYGSQAAPIVRAKMAVQMALDLMPRWKLAVPGMAISSALPKPDELTGEGGFARWIKRGFMISLDVAEGKTPLSDTRLSPMAKASNTCLIDGQPWHFMARVSVDGGDNPNLATGSFEWYAKIEPNGQARLIGVHDDPSWLQKFGAGAAALMIKLGTVFCTAQPAVQAQMQSSVAEKCVDSSGKPCTKGTPGCNCIAPSAATQGGVGLWNFMAGKMCQGWMAEYAQNPNLPLPHIPDPPPVEIKPAWTKFVPWILGGLAAGAGAYAISKR